LEQKVFIIQNPGHSDFCLVHLYCFKLMQCDGAVLYYKFMSHFETFT